MQRPSQQAAAYSRVIQRDGEPPLRLFSHRPLNEVAADIFTDADRRLRKYPKRALSTGYSETQRV